MTTSPRASSNLISTLFWLIPLLIAGAFFISGLHLYILSSESENWPHTTAVINDVTVREEKARRSNWFDAWIEYQYEVGPETYTGQDGPFMINNSTNEPLEEKEALQRALERFPQGRLIEVAYDPIDHERSTLYAGKPQKAYKNFMIAISCLLLAVWIGLGNKRHQQKT